MPTVKFTYALKKNPQLEDIPANANSLPEVFKEIEPNYPGHSSYVFDKTGTLAFGTTTGNLFFSDDKGESWRVLNNYLPMVYSVQFVD